MQGRHVRWRTSATGSGASAASVSAAGVSAAGIVRRASTRAGVALPLGVALPEWSFCTYSLARRLLPELESYRLGDLARNLGFPDEGSHRALPDSRTAARLFNRLMVDLLSLGIETLGGALRFQQERRRPRSRDASS